MYWGLYRAENYTFTNETSAGFSVNCIHAHSLYTPFRAHSHARLRLVYSLHAVRLCITDNVIYCTFMSEQRNKHTMAITSHYNDVCHLVHTLNNKSKLLHGGKGGIKCEVAL